ncbi:methenyltetrahydromethanopterin cyclohydrolase [Oscillospiraceae bacterium WX1]
MILPLSRDPALSPNKQALSHVEELIACSLQLRVDVFTQRGATIVDCGVKARGGFEAGLLFSKICLGGLADVTLQYQDFGGIVWPTVNVVTDHPVRACMASQFAGWQLKCDSRVYVGSGPACAVVPKGNIFAYLDYQDHADAVILCLESAKLPPDEVIDMVCAECRCAPENLTVLVAPTASATGAVQVAARTLETGLFKLRRLKYDLGKIVSGIGICPISPVAADTSSALGRTNDAISYGGTVICNVHDDDDTLRAVVGRVPTAAMPNDGLAYFELDTSAGDFYKLSPDQFNPAVIWLCNLESGNSFSAGTIRPDVLRRSFGFQA